MGNFQCFSDFLDSNTIHTRLNSLVISAQYSLFLALTFIEIKFVSSFPFIPRFNYFLIFNFNSGFMVMKHYVVINIIIRGQQQDFHSSFLVCVVCYIK